MDYGTTYIFAMLVCGTFGIASLSARAHGFARPGLAEHLVLLLLGTLAAIAIHQAGHWLAGAAQGFRTVRFTMGPTEFAAVEGGWRIRRVRFRHAGMLYQVPSSFQNFRVQKATWLAAGPCVSLIAFLFFTRLALRSTAHLGFWFWIVNAQMCFIGVLQLFPLRLRGVESDGLQLWRILQGGEPADAMERDLLADSVNYTPLRPRDWPSELIRRLEPTAGDGASAQARYIFYVAYIHSLDSRNTPAAWSHLAPLLSGWTAGDGPQYALEAAYFLAFHRGDIAEARQWLARETRLEGDPVRQRAEAAVEFAEGRHGSALQRIDRALHALRSERPSGNREFEIDCLDAMREEMAARSLVHPSLVETEARESRPIAVYWPGEARANSLADSAPSSC
ncbi:MAG TPA: hypothetical protein VMH81_33705 [Bryobacteraceae bacterium]|nr:hypothetical protein [Bryobacteraceae bacterium]